mgnify:CR=1 FL=1
MMDALILAGGRGTRLKGLWDGPKCLVPVGGVSLLERLLTKLVPLRPEFVALATGDWREEVMEFALAHQYPFKWVDVPDLMGRGRKRGTATAVRRAVLQGAVSAPLLVLNGDTLPMYDLASLIAYHEARKGAWATAAVRRDVLAWRDVYAGACVLSEAALDEICADDRTYDFPAHLIGAYRYVVPGFLDVGTPDGFQRAKEWRDE